jgi:CBS domain-containing protein
MTTLVRDVMTDAVVTVDQATPFKDVTRALAAHRIGAVPVLDPRGRVAGIVSETDLLLKHEQQHATEAGRSPFEGRRRRDERRRAAGRTARDLMSAPAATVAPMTPVAQAARVMRERHVKHLPVVDGDGRLVGIVSRGDLARVFLRPDGDLLRDVQALLESFRPDLDPAAIQVRVAGGVVELTGFAERRSTALLLAYRARRLDGVVGVDARVDFHLDDWTPVHEAADPCRAVPLRR